MKMVRVEEMPVTQRGCRYKLQNMIKEFIQSGCHIVRIDGVEDEYKNAKSCAGSLSAAIKRSGHYSIKVHTINGSVYLENTLMSL